jgi:predicted nucleic acid-binding protein
VIRYVIDASVIGPLLFEDEANDLLPMLLEALALGECVVPSHWRIEVANQLISGVRRKRATPGEAAHILADLAQLSVEIDASTAERCWSRTYDLAAFHKLTIYDAAYLELAERRSLTLVSADGDLVKAAHAASLSVLTPA